MLFHCNITHGILENPTGNYSVPGIWGRERRKEIGLSSHSYVLDSRQHNVLTPFLSLILKLLSVNIAVHVFC
jgi:hypothetical protein